MKEFIFADSGRTCNMHIRKKLKLLLKEHREECFRCFKIGKICIRKYSSKYAFRELQAEINQLQNEYGNIKLDIQQLSKDICKLRTDIAIDEKEVIEKLDDDKKAILISVEELQKQYDSLIQSMNEISKKQETMALQG